jgi:transketolase
MTAVVLSNAEAGECKQPDVALLATGSEVHLALNAHNRLASDGVKARVVSLPCWSLFEAQPETHRNQVLPQGIPTLAIEAGVTLGWTSYVGPPAAIIGVDRFGASTPGEVVMREYRFTVENVCQQVGALLQCPIHPTDSKTRRSS